MPTETLEPTPEFTATLQFTLTPRVTATIGVLMDKAEWNSQTVEDGTEEPIGTAFHVTWTFRNVGPTEWTNQYSIVFKNGDQMGALPSIPLSKNVKYTETIDVSADFVAPATLGAKTSNWCLTNASNQCFYPFFIQIVVVAGSAGVPTATATITATP
jgi:hypothetical protein